MGMQSKRGGLFRGHIGDQGMYMGELLVDEEGVAASGNSGDLTGFGPYGSYLFFLKLSDKQEAVADTLNIYVQRKMPDGQYDDLVSFTQMLGNGTDADEEWAEIYSGAQNGIYDGGVSDGALSAGSVAADVFVPDILRVKWVVVEDTAASFDFKLWVQAHA